LEKTLHEKGLVVWLKVKALRSSSNTAGKKKSEIPGALCAYLHQ
jgi:hypothetical protein